MKVTNLYFILIPCLLGLISCKGTIDGVEIKGTLNKAEGTTVKILSQDYKTSYDSTTVRNNQFSLSPKVPSNGFYQLNFSSAKPGSGSEGSGKFRRNLLVYLEENSDYTFHADGPAALGRGFYSVKSSSATQQELDKFYQIQNETYAELNGRKNYYLTMADINLEEGNDPAYRNYIDSIYMIEKEVNRHISTAIERYSKKAVSSLIIPYLISKREDFFENYTMYKTALDGLDKEHKNSDYAKQAYASLAAVEKLRKGAEMPQIYGNDVQGKPFEYDYSKNKYTLVNIWAAWSVNSRHETPELKKVYSAYKQKGFDVVAVSVDKDKDGWIRVSGYDSIPWYNVSEALPISESKNVATFNPTYLPVNYLVDQNKIVIRRNIEMKELEKFLGEELQVK